MAQVHYDAGFVTQAHPIDTFAQAMRAIGEPIFGRTVRDVSMAKLLQQLFDTTRRFDMQMQPQLLLLQKTMMVVEGVARSLDPDFDIWEASRPVVEKWMMEQIGPEARLRDAAEGIDRARPSCPQSARSAAQRRNGFRHAGGGRAKTSPRYGAPHRRRTGRALAQHAHGGMDRGGGVGIVGGRNASLSLISDIDI